MGDIVKTVKICGLAKSGELLKPVHATRDWPEVEALVDTGATASVITRTLAELAGAEIIPGLRTHKGQACDGALMVLQLAGCKPSYHMVIVDDRLAASAEPQAFMILGHDYLQDQRARIDYDNGEVVTCPPRLPPSKKPSKPSNGSSGRRTKAASRSR
jgi:hypothetical protein